MEYAYNKTVLDNLGNGLNLGMSTPPYTDMEYAYNKMVLDKQGERWHNVYIN